MCCMLSGASVTLNLILRKLSNGPLTMIESWSAAVIGVRLPDEAPFAGVARVRADDLLRERDGGGAQRDGTRARARTEMRVRCMM